MHLYYGLDLADLWRGQLSTRKAALLVSQLPRGAMTWQMFGGAGAITAEQEEQWIIQHLLQVQMWQASGSKGARPQIREYPKGAFEAQEKERRAIEQAEAFRRKHLNTID